MKLTYRLSRDDWSKFSRMAPRRVIRKAPVWTQLKGSLPVPLIVLARIPIREPKARDAPHIGDEGGTERAPVYEAARGEHDQRGQRRQRLSPHHQCTKPSHCRT